MAKRSTQLAINIPLRRLLRGWRGFTRGARLIAIALACGLAASATTASTDEPCVTLRPYTAEYKTTARGLSLTLNRRLKLGADGTYTLTNGGKMMVVGFHEVSVFQLQGNQIAPKSYVYQGTGLINRRREIHFSPGSATIRSLYKKEWYDLPNSGHTLDRLSQQEQLRLLLLNNPTPQRDIVLRIADARRVKEYRLAFIGEEQVETPLGAVRSLHFERLHDDPDRKSHIWVAPEWDYLMVKTLHVEDDKPVQVLLTSATIDGAAVALD